MTCPEYRQQREDLPKTCRHCQCHWKLPGTHGSRRAHVCTEVHNSLWKAVDDSLQSCESGTVRYPLDIVCSESL
jgi:hypothetical protein